MKSKCVIALMVLMGMVAGANAGTISWISSDLGAGYTAGWQVALFEDVSKDGWDATMINPLNGLTDSDDVFLGITAALSSGKAGMAWGSSFSAPSGGMALSDRVYSVLFNAADMASASQFKVGTMTTQGNAWYVLPATDTDATYTTTTVGSWQAVPEPATALLFGIGGLGAWIIRRKKVVG